MRPGTFNAAIYKAVDLSSVVDINPHPLKKFLIHMFDVLKLVWTHYI